MRSIYGVNIVTDKDQESDEWVVSAIEKAPSIKVDGSITMENVKYKTELGRGNSIDDAYVEALKEMLSATRNALCAVQTHSINVHRYLDVYEKVEVERTLD